MAYNFGRETSQNTDTFPGSPDRAIITAFTSGAAGAMSRAWVYFPTAAGSGDNCKVVVYNSGGGGSGNVTTLVEASAGTAIPSGGGWVDCGAMSVSIAASTEYYMGVTTDGYTDMAEYYVYGSGFDSFYSADCTYSSPPNNPTASGLYTDWEVQVYVVVDTAGGATPHYAFGLPLHGPFRGPI